MSYVDETFARTILSTVDALAATARGKVRYTAWTFGTETAHRHVEYPPPPRDARVALHRASTRAAARSVSRFGRRRADEMREASAVTEGEYGTLRSKILAEVVGGRAS